MTAHICSTCGAMQQRRSGHCQSCGTALLPFHTTPPLPSGTHSANPSPGIAPGALLENRYQVIKLLGSGGMGSVFLALDTRLNHKALALKALPATLDPQASAAFQREALLLSQLRHEHLPRVSDVFEADGYWYLAMDYIQGQTLEISTEERGGILVPEEALHVGITLCRILAYLHAQQPPVIFRDLKPQNILRQPDGKLFLIDFGIARHFTGGQARDTTAFGSVGYAPPEQYGRAQTIIQSDLYALGAVLHRLLTGDDPSVTPFRFAAVRFPALPVFEGQMQRLLQSNAADRPASAEDVQHLLEHAQAVLAQERTGTLGTNVSPGQSGTLQSAPGVPCQALRGYVWLVYDPTDQPHVERFKRSLTGLVKRVYHLEWLQNEQEQAWQRQLAQADVVLAIVSPAFFHGEMLDLWEHHIHALALEQNTTVIPIFLTPPAGFSRQEVATVFDHRKETPYLQWITTMRTWDTALSMVGNDLKVVFDRRFPRP